MVNSTLLELQWEEPFTWPHTSIIDYTISANNSQENWNRTGYADTTLLISALGELADECTVYTFTVVARNELADGVPGTVTGGFPIGMSTRGIFIQGGMFKGNSQMEQGWWNNSGQSGPILANPPRWLLSTSSTQL